jgi:hypothetical protein
MRLRTAIPALLLALAAAPLAAQGSNNQDVSRRIQGVWEGAYESAQVPPGSLKLTIGREGEAWKVTLEVFTEQPPPAGEVRNFSVSGSKLSWVQTIAEMECASTATLENGLLKGSAECIQGGAIVATATFSLEKKS